MKEKDGVKFENGVISFEIGTDCDSCNKEIEKIMNGFFEDRKSGYMGDVPCVVMVPMYSRHGFIEKWHVNIVDSKNKCLS